MAVGIAAGYIRGKGGGVPNSKIWIIFICGSGGSGGDGDECEMSILDFVKLCTSSGN